LRVIEEGTIIPTTPLGFISLFGSFNERSIESFICIRVSIQSVFVIQLHMLAAFSLLLLES